MNNLKALFYSVFCLGAMLPGFCHAEVASKWTLTAVQDAPCRSWNPNNGTCLKWDTYLQYFPDYDSMLSGFQLYSEIVSNLDSRIAGLEIKLRPNTPPNSTTIPQWSIQSVEALPCRMWRGKTGTCQTWDAYAQHFPDFTTAATVFQLYAAAINALGDRVASLELIVNPAGTPNPGHVADVALVAVETAPCTSWAVQNGRCGRAYTHLQHYPGYTSAVEAFNAGSTAVTAIDGRVRTIENLP